MSQKSNHGELNWSTLRIMENVMKSARWRPSTIYIVPAILRSTGRDRLIVEKCTDPKTSAEDVDSWDVSGAVLVPA